jgi:hypothetical protein
MNAQQVWQSQDRDAPRVSLAFIRHHSDALRRRSRLRDGIKYAVGMAALVIFPILLWDHMVARPMLAAGIVLWIAAMLFTMRQTYRRAGARAPAEDFGTLDALRFYRQELVRQRDAQRGSWRWWLPPIVPSLLAVFASLFFEVSPTPWRSIGKFCVYLVILFGVGIAKAERSARRYQREIDALDSLSRG